jgi:hypothetical protein
MLFFSRFRILSNFDFQKLIKVVSLSGSTILHISELFYFFELRLFFPSISHNLLSLIKYHIQLFIILQFNTRIKGSLELNISFFRFFKILTNFL